MRKTWKLVIIAIMVSIIIANIPRRANASVSVKAQSAILMEQQTGRILFEKDANTKRRIASITKIMTAIIAIESGKMNKYVTVSDRAARTEGSSVYLKPGEKIKLKDLVYGLMLRSGNDTAVAIAEYLGGSVDGFALLMNQKAREIGMYNSHFTNPHGLDDSPNHYSTAYDMALLMRYAMQNKTFRTISGTKVYRAPNPTEAWDRVWKNKNRLLTKYQYCTGGKTGYTKMAKRTLVTTATKGNMDLIVVTLNDSDDWNDHIAMYENGFKNFNMVEVLPKGNVDLPGNSQFNGHLYLKDSVTYPASSKETGLFSVKYKLNKPSGSMERSKNETVVGKAQVFLDGRVVEEEPIYFQSAAEKKKGFFDFMKEIFLAEFGVRTNG